MQNMREGSFDTFTFDLPDHRGLESPRLHRKRSSPRLLSKRSRKQNRKRSSPRSERGRPHSKGRDQRIRYVKERSRVSRRTLTSQMWGEGGYDSLDSDDSAGSDDHAGRAQTPPLIWLSDTTMRFVEGGDTNFYTLGLAIADLVFLQFQYPHGRVRPILPSTIVDFPVLQFLRPSLIWLRDHILSQLKEHKFGSLYSGDGAVAPDQSLQDEAARIQKLINIDVLRTEWQNIIGEEQPTVDKLINALVGWLRYIGMYIAPNADPYSTQGVDETSEQGRQVCHALLIAMNAPAADEWQNTIGACGIRKDVWNVRYGQGIHEAVVEQLFDARCVVTISSENEDDPAMLPWGRNARVVVFE